MCLTPYTVLFTRFFSILSLLLEFTSRDLPLSLTLSFFHTRTSPATPPRFVTNDRRRLTTVARVATLSWRRHAVTLPDVTTSRHKKSSVELRWDNLLRSYFHSHRYFEYTYAYALFYLIKSSLHSSQSYYYVYYYVNPTLLLDCGFLCIYIKFESAKLHRMHII